MSDQEEKATEGTETQKTGKPPKLPANKLSKDSDHAARPGFRSPPNQGSKAMKNKKKKR